MTTAEQLKKRFVRLLLTSMSKKIVVAAISGWMVYHLILQGKFGVDWTGPATAFGIWMTFVGHVFNIDLKTKEMFVLPAERSDRESLYP